MAHGDDQVLGPNGEDTYGCFKEAGRFKVFKRTEGISTTDIVGKLLLFCKDMERKFSNVESPMTTNMYIKNINLED